jgi:tryptophan-rich sensory protein
MKLPKSNFLKLVIAVALCQLAGIIGSAFTFSAIPAWYAFLNKPAFSPPNWLFGPVWTMLYTLMGISLYLVWKTRFNKKFKNIALNIFYIQLILNSVWSILFFGLRNPVYAFIEIIMLWLTIAISIKTFYKINKTASYLLVPYLLWVSFASVLNFAIAILN